MKKFIFPFLFLLSIGYIGYEHKTDFNQISEKFSKDPAEYVLNANVSHEEIIDTFYNPVYKHIDLEVGIAKKYGLRHILARHTQQYFTEFANKNEQSMFQYDINGHELIDAIRQFYKHCVDIPIYSTSDSNQVFVGFTKINEIPIKCLLIVKKTTHSIVTFYPLQKSWEENLKSQIIRDNRSWRWD